MKVAIATMHVKAGHCEENMQYMKEKIEKAIQQQADLIVFPQNAVSGYLLGDRWLDPTWCEYVDSFNEQISALSDKIAIVWGNVKYRHGKLFNCAFFAYKSATAMRVKVNENHDYLQDSRYFTKSEIDGAISYMGYQIALNFGQEVRLCDININIDACPYDVDEHKDICGNVIYVNAVGMQNHGKQVMVMQGGSFVLNHKHLVYQADYFKEEMMVVDYESDIAQSWKQASLLDGLLLGIKDFDEQVFNKRFPWVLGLSGGLDSSMTCALLALALGSDRVHGFNMATKYNRDTTIQNARLEAQALGIHYYDGSIQKLVEASKDTFMNEYGFNAEAQSSLVMENIQARARGYMLGGFAGVLGGVIANNGNKVEMMLGYCTLYGDSVGALAFIADLTKVQLFELAHEINNRMQKEVIPYNLLPKVENGVIDWKMPPSAELKDDQFDPMKWFYHDYLCDHLGKDLDVITFMQQYLNDTVADEVQPWLKYYGLNDPKEFIKDLDWFTQTMHRNAFKRLQTPPILCVHKKNLATQIDSQMSYDQKMYEQLKNEIIIKGL